MCLGVVSGGCFVGFWWLKGGWEEGLLLLCRVEREGGERKDRNSLESLVQNENKMKILQFILGFTWLKMKVENSRILSLIKA